MRSRSGRNNVAEETAGQTVIMAPWSQEKNQNDPFLSHDVQMGRGSGWTREPQKVQQQKQVAYKENKGKDAGPSAFVLWALPLVFFIINALTFMLLWQLAKGVPILIAFIMLGSVFGYTVKNSRGKEEGGLLPSLSGKNAMQAMKVWLHIVVAWLAVALGAVTGLHADESSMNQFLAITFGREYENVLASTPGAAYSDAGKMFFASSSKVDTDRAIGFQEGTVYCAAPIVDENQGRNAIAFWAIGYDCCDARGKFECGDAGNSKVRGGVRAPPDVLFSEDTGLFLKAVQQASAVHNLDIDEDVVMLHWVENPDSVAVAKLFAAFGTCLIGWALFGLLVLVLNGVGLFAEHEYTEGESHHSLSEDMMT